MFDPEEVDGDKGGHESDVHGETDPPHDLLPSFDLQIAQDVDADEEAGKGTGEMGGVTHLSVHVLHIAVVNSRAHVDAHQYDDKQQAPNGEFHLLPILREHQKAGVNDWIPFHNNNNNNNKKRLRLPE